MIFAHQVEDDEYFFLYEDGHYSGNFFTCRLTFDSKDSMVIDNQAISSSRIGLYYSNLMFENDSILMLSANQFLLTFDKLDQYKLINENLAVRAQTVCVYEVGGNYWQLSNNVVFVSNPKGELLKRIFIKGFGLIRCLVEETDSTIVLGGDSGLAKVNMNTYAVDQWKGINDCIYSCVKHEEDLWCGTNNGIIQVRNRKLLRRLTMEDGIQGLEFNTNSSAVDDSGNIYLGGVNGITAFHPDSLQNDWERSTTLIPKVVIDNKREIDIEFEYRPEIILNPGEHSISFRPSVVGKFPSSFYNNQYAIPNHTPGWIDAGKNTTIHHSFEPGRHRVYYRSNTYFDPNAPYEQYFEIRAKSHWYESWLFYFMLIILFSASIIYLIVMRNQALVKEKIKQLETKEKIQDERSRISRELHDNIGAQLGIMRRSIDWILHNFEEYPAVDLKRNLTNLNEIAAGMNQSIRDTIWASKKEMFSIQDLAARISSFIHKLKENIPEIAFHFVPPTGNKKLTAPAALNLYRIVQEALHNAIKHSQARNIWVHIVELENNVIKVKVKDDGKGMNTKKTHFGNGIKNLVKRASDSNFKLDINSELNEGTSINVEF